MSSKLADSLEDIILNEVHFERMKKKIVDSIKENIITKEKNHSKMVNEIREIITTEAKKNF